MGRDETIQSSFHAREISDAAIFLQSSTEFRSVEPVATQVISGAATSVAKGLSGYERCTWWLVESDSEIVGIAMHTEPFNLFLSPMPVEAAQVLAELMMETHPDFPGVNGPRDAVTSFIERCATLTSSPMKFELHQEHLAYLVTQIIPPHDVVGQMRPANPRDRELALEWFLGFAVEANVEDHNLEKVVDRAIATNRLYLWIVNDVVVSICGHSADVEIPNGTLARVGPVYTPPEYRKNGYASFLVAEVSQLLQNRGVSVMLYADANYPDSNKVYINIGFELVGSNSIWNKSSNQ